MHSTPGIAVVDGGVVAGLGRRRLGSLVGVVYGHGELNTTGWRGAGPSGAGARPILDLERGAWRRYARISVGPNQSYPVHLVSKTGGARGLTPVSKTGGGRRLTPVSKNGGGRRLTLVSKTGGGPEADPRIKDWGGPEADPWNYDDSRAEPGLTPPTGLEPYVA